MSQTADHLAIWLAVLSWQPAHHVLLRLPLHSAKCLTQSSWLAKLKDTSRSPRQILHLVDVDTENLRW